MCPMNKGGLFSSSRVPEFIDGPVKVAAQMPAPNEYDVGKVVGLISGVTRRNIFSDCPFQAE